MTKIKELRECFREDLLAYSRAGGWPPSAKMALKLLLFQPGFQLACSIRLQKALRALPLIGPLLCRILWYCTTIWFGVEINIDARFGSGIYFPHPNGIVVAADVVIGPNVAIYQQVTIGRGKVDDPTVPHLGTGTVVYAGAKIIGPLTIGENAVIGANAVVIKDVPANHMALGVPAKNRPLKVT